MKRIYVVLFLLISALILLVSYEYKKDIIKIKNAEYFDENSFELHKSIEKLIKQRQDNQLLTLQQVVLDDKVQQFVRKGNFDKAAIAYIADKLYRGTGIKNVWFQFIDNKGVCVARSWRKKKGDNLSLIRDDVLSIINKPRVLNSISVGWFDMTFKTMIPIYDKQHHFLGAMEMISNFDNIAKKIEDTGYKAVVLVDKHYTQQLKDPRTKLFVNDYYVANANADPKLLGYIKAKPLSYFISPYHSYVINGDKVIFNYALMDKKETLIANFLLFRDLNSFDRNELKAINVKINIATFLVLFLTAISFYLLSSGHLFSFELNTTFLKLLLLFLFTYFLYFVLVSFYFKDQKNTYLESYNNQIHTDFQNIQYIYSNLADMIFKMTIQKPHILDILLQAQQPNMKKEARKKLYNALKYDYELFKNFGVRQLHFHLKNNESLLRFHRPNIYGDNLSNVRETVKWVNTYHEKVQGFEEGRIFNGYRYIYPIVDEYNPAENLYLGSVEISFSTFYLIHDLAYMYKFKSTFLIKSDVVNKKIFKNQGSNYINSIYKNWSFDRAVSEKLKNLSIDADLSVIGKEEYEQINEEIEKGKIFSIEEQVNKEIFTFIPLHNPITKKVVAVIVLQKDKGVFTMLRNNYYIALLIGFMFLLFVFLYMYKEVTLKKQYKLLSRKTQRILDGQDSIIVITTNDEIIDVNKRFLEFFGFDTLAQFKQHYNCISDKFIEDGRLMGKGTFENRQEWMRELAKMQSKDKIVSMMDKFGEVHFFSVKESSFDDNYLLEFVDISDTMKEKFQYINKAYKDNLTQVYNREYFDAHVKSIVKGIGDAVLGVIFCDIDYFKEVNDTYGHEVGDRILKKVTNVMRAQIRAEDIIIRWGGEEFLIFLYVDSEESLTKIAEGIKEAIASYDFEEIDRLTCSFGLSIYVEGEDILTTIKRADKALYTAKQFGRNRVEFKQKEIE